MSQYELQTVSPDVIGICPDHWNRTLTFAQQLCDSGKVPALSMQIQRHGQTTGVHHFGSRSLQEQIPLSDETRFVIASLTKPVLALATLILVERGALSLNQQAREFLPEIQDPAKRPITVKHLLSHTSGLPDMLPNNTELRLANAPLSQFVQESFQANLVFPPGRSAQYQSMGYAWLGEIIERVCGMPCREFLQREIFGPLGMSDSSLGILAEESDVIQVAEVDLPASMKASPAGSWNTSFWQQLCAPWGGMFSTCADMSRFLRMVLIGVGKNETPNLLSRTSVRESLENRLADYPSIPPSEVSGRGWGLGWRLNWKDHRGTFSDLLPASVAGHWGASGTLFWIDPQREIGVVLLSTRPIADGVSPLTHLSNMIAAGFRHC